MQKHKNTAEIKTQELRKILKNEYKLREVF